MKKTFLISFLVACLSVLKVSAQCTTFSGTTGLVLAPISPTATALTQNAIRVSWTAPADPSITGFEVYRFNGTDYCLIATPASNVTQINDNGLTAQTTYQYRIYSRTGASAPFTYSPVASTSGTTLSSVLPPSNLAATPVFGTNNQVLVTWSDNANNETNYEVLFATSSGAELGRALLTGANATSGLITGLQPNTVYHFLVRAGGTPTASPNAGPVTVATYPSPARPSNVVVFPITNNSATVAWDDNSNDEVGFQVAYGFNGTNLPFVVNIPAQPGVGRRSHTITGLNQNSNYSVIVRVLGPGNIQLDSQPPVNFITCPNAPSTPVSLAIINSDLNSVTLGWVNTSSTPVSNVVIERSTDGGASYNTFYDTQGPNLPIYTDTRASGAGPYFYRVRAINNCQGNTYSSGTSNIVSFQRNAPKPAYNLAAKVILDTRVDLSWSNNTESVNPYDKRVAIEVWRRPDSVAAFSRLATLTPEQFTYVDLAASPKVKYFYKIITTNQFGTSESNVVDVTTFGPPIAPSNLVATPTKNNVGSTIIALSWKDNSNDEDFFIIEESVEGGAWKSIAQIIPNSTQFVRIPVEEGVKYSYRVRGANNWGIGRPSNIAMDAVYEPTVAPNAPFNLKARALSASEIQLTWLDDANNETAFEVEISADGRTFRALGTTTRNVLTYTDKGLIEKTKYFYRVRATNAKGNSAYTNTAEATTLSKTLAIVTNDTIGGDVIAYPNPTVDYVKITVPSSLKGAKNVVVIDRNSRIVLRTTLKEGQDELNLDMSTYNEGTYTVTIQNETGKVTKRIVKY
ncbi:MAG: fibronectin type III domain-containing protein [Spirosomaceae bacterium]|jgi:titin|nr:fibronectin type III domain-containing protein [Spirosomataceae bacterium]